MTCPGGTPNLASAGQIKQIQALFQAFAQKQANVPTVGQMLLQNRATVRQVITTMPFNGAAQQLVQQATAVISQATMNRLELRNRIFQVLTPQQRENYIQMVQEAVAGIAAVTRLPGGLTAMPNAQWSTPTRRAPSP